MMMMMMMIPFSQVDGPWLRVFSFRSFCPSLRPMLNLQACAHRRSIRKGDHLTGQQVEAGLAAVGLDKITDFHRFPWMDFESCLLVDVHECLKYFKVLCWLFIHVYIYIYIFICCFLISVCYLWLIVVVFCWFVWMFKDVLNVCVFFMLSMFSVNVHMRHHCLSIRSVDCFQWIVIFHWMFTAFHKVWIVMAWFQVPISVWWFHESNGAIETDQTSDCWTIGIRIEDMEDDTWSYMI